jgi:hypothetical protein
MLPALRLPEPLPFLIGMKDGLLPTQQRHRAATSSVFHQFLPDRFLKVGRCLHHDRYGGVTAGKFVGSEAREHWPMPVSIP